MDELELLTQLQTIQNKLENNEELTDQEYKLFASVLYATTIGIIEKSLNYVLSLLPDENEKYNNIELPEEEDK